MYPARDTQLFVLQWNDIQWDEKVKPNLPEEKLAECRKKFPHALININQEGVGELLGTPGVEINSANGSWEAMWANTSGKECLDLRFSGTVDEDYNKQYKIQDILLYEHFGRMAHTVQTAYLFDLLLALRTEKLRLETALKMHDEYKTKIMAALTALAISIGTFLANFLSDVVVKEL